MIHRINLISITALSSDKIYFFQHKPHTSHEYLRHVRRQNNSNFFPEPRKYEIRQTISIYHATRAHIFPLIASNDTSHFEHINNARSHVHIHVSNTILRIICGSKLRSCDHDTRLRWLIVSTVSTGDIERHGSKFAKCVHRTCSTIL